MAVASRSAPARRPDPAPDGVAKAQREACDERMVIVTTPPDSVAETSHGSGLSGLVEAQELATGVPSRYTTTSEGLVPGGRSAAGNWKVSCKGLLTEPRGAVIWTPNPRALNPLAAWPPLFLVKVTPLQEVPPGKETVTRSRTVPLGEVTAGSLEQASSSAPPPPPPPPTTTPPPPPPWLPPPPPATGLMPTLGPVGTHEGGPVREPLGFPLGAPSVVPLTKVLPVDPTNTPTRLGRLTPGRMDAVSCDELYGPHQLLVASSRPSL